MARDRPYDRTVKIKRGEKILLVDGDDELFLTATARGVAVVDARGFDLELTQPHDDEVLIFSRSRR